ncbi:hypothetical protein ABN028_14125 [Actinopolymorpha sp. B17G11]|uniref:hypothetical protein n=1 Tax=unclassified Actinopolymorpha TaxID=2627063 RepID=UPI0032D8B663
MRDNGLQAASYVAIADLDPSVADRMLDVLGTAQVAAYTEPCPPVLGPCLEIRLPAVPCDRLFVDKEAEDQARALLADQLPRQVSGGGEDTEPAQGQATLDEDEAWAAIIAGYDATAPDAVPRWPVQEDDNAAEHRTTESAPPPGGETTTETSVETPAGSAERGHASSAADEERFVPPPPPPLPRVEMVTKLAWVAFLGGPVLLLLATVAGSYAPSWFVVVGVVCFITGFLTLVVRMKGGPPDDEDGAIV